jgi:hypothetical protein
MKARKTYKTQSFLAVDVIFFGAGKMGNILNLVACRAGGGFPLHKGTGKERNRFG